MPASTVQPPIESSLPVAQVLPELIRRLAEQRRAILVAAPGSGKTTLVPLALLSAPLLAQGQRILLLEPRRLAARSSAAFMARRLGEQVGEQVGYRVRFDSCCSPRTRIEVITIGVFLRMLQNDPALDRVAVVIFDEIHERSLEADLALALTRDAALGLRDDLHLLAMSATLDSGALSEFLDQAPVIEAAGTAYPVTCHHRPPSSERHFARQDLVRAVTACVPEALSQQSGDILVFVPGQAEIALCQAALQPVVGAGVVVLPLHGAMPLADQEAVMRPSCQRRVLVATTVAETSLTIEGIGAVIDGGWKRVPGFDPGSGLTRLRTVRVSLASARQRAGRAGRLGPGHCYQLWSQHTQQGMLAYDQPEIRQADLCALVLHLAEWGVADSGALTWLEPPPSGAEQQASSLLHHLAALDEQGRLTARGRQMASLPVHPRLAALLLAGRAQAGLACDLAALLGEADLLGRHAGADIEDRLQAIVQVRQGAPGNQRARAVVRISAQIRRLMPKPGGHDQPARSIGALVAQAYPDRLARQEEPGGTVYKLAGGRRVCLGSADPLRNARWLAVAEVDGARPMGRIRRAARISLQEIEKEFAQAIHRADHLQWEPNRRQVQARRHRLLGAILLDQEPWPDPDPVLVDAALLEVVKEQGLDLLPWHASTRLFRLRVGCLRRWLPEEDWPDWSEQTLRAEVQVWLAPFLDGSGRPDGIDCHAALRSQLSWEQVQRLDSEAPTHLDVPSGSRRPLTYQDDGTVVLAVRLQEMFGLAETPCLARGRLRVLMHLLSPAGRPVQVTDDLAGFWNGTYHAVKRELKGRYPKHHWPDDPWQAQPTARTKARSDRRSR